nr:RrF2 family transcriptional regulator [uncultured Ruminococcus sp.]
MMVSTRGRYALRVLIDLAEHNSGAYIPMKDVAARQDISLKYLERILPTLTKAKLIEGVHGKGGGYKLTRSPEDYTVGEVLRLTEGDLAPVACLSAEAEPCDKAAECRTLGMWKGFYDLTNKYFDGITIASLTSTETADNYVI